MTRAEFLKKYPRPWRFDRTDRGGDGVILDANGHPLVILRVDYDWAENNDAPEPIFCPIENELGTGDMVGPERERRDLLLDILLGSSP